MTLRINDNDPRLIATEVNDPIYVAREEMIIESNVLATVLVYKEPWGK